MEDWTMKKEYMKPQMQVVQMKPSTLICTSTLHSVSINRETEMTTDEDFE